MTSDPIRLLDDPSAASVLRADMIHATEAELEGFNLAAGLAELQAATTAAGGSVASGTSLSTPAKLGLGAAVTMGVALWLGLGHREDRKPEPERVDSVIAGRGAAVERSSDRSEVEPSPVRPAMDRAGDRVTAEGEPGGTMTMKPVTASVEGSAPSAMEPASAGSNPAGSAPLDSAPPDSAPSQRSAPGSVDAEAHEDSSAASGRPSHGRPARGTRATQRASDAVDDRVLREARLVARARASLTPRPQRALSLAEQAEREFPRGQLIEERRAVAIRALVRLGRHDEAERRAEAFLAEYGRGAHAAAVRRALNSDR